MTAEDERSPDRRAALHETRTAAARVMLKASETPYLTLERLQAHVDLSRLFGPEVWSQLEAEIVAARP